MMNDTQDRKQKPEHDNLVLTCNPNRCDLWILRLNSNGMSYYYFPILSGDKLYWMGADDNLRKKTFLHWLLLKKQYQHCNSSLFDAL